MSTADIVLILIWVVIGGIITGGIAYAGRNVWPKAWPYIQKFGSTIRKVEIKMPSMVIFVILAVVIFLIVMPRPWPYAWSTSSTTTTKVPVNVEKPDPPPRIKDLLALTGTYTPEEIESFQVVIPGSTLTPEWGFEKVLAPESDSDVVINLIKTSAAQPPVFYSLDPILGRPMTFDEVEGYKLKDGQRQASAFKYGNLPFLNSTGISNLSSEATVTYLQAFDSEENSIPTDLHVNVAFKKTWATTNGQFLRHSQYELEVQQWYVDLGKIDDASFVIPQGKWRHVWIVPIMDKAYLPRLLGESVPPQGLSADELLASAKHAADHVQSSGGTKHEAEKKGEQIISLIDSPIDHSLIKPYGMYYSVNGEVKPLTKVVTFKGTNESFKGSTVTMGLNLEERIMPARAIVGVSRFKKDSY